jgi:hypothetical protein
MSASTLPPPGSVQRDLEQNPNQSWKERESAKLSTASITENHIAVLAYSLWQQRGCPAGSAEADWFEAERQLRKRH